jgi:hemin uptake protein HemP
MKTSTSPARPGYDGDPSDLDRPVVRQGVGRVRSEKLLGTLRELEIEHGAELYRLRVTSTGKLILTK